MVIGMEEIRVAARQVLDPARVSRDPRSGRLDRDGTAPDTVALRLAFRPPYGWRQVRDFLATRQVPGVERVDARGYARTIRSQGGYAIVGVRPLDGEYALELRVCGAKPAELFQISSDARRMFDLAADPARISAALRPDALVGPLIRRRPGLRIPGAWDPFECAVRAVLGQQVTVAGSRTLAARLVARFGEPVEGSADGLTHLFPSAAVLADADLEGLGLTRARGRALQALAGAVSIGAVDFQAPAADVAVALAALPGIGSWTAQYVALRALGEPDAFPAADLVLRRMAAAGSVPLTTRALEARAEAWRPWRSYATLHLWCAAGARPRSG